MSWKPFGDDVEFGEAHDALACAHEEPLHVPMKKMFWKPFGDDVEFGEAHLLDDGAHGCLDRALPFN